MGANQSSAHTGHTALEQLGEVKTSYYELLALDRQATDDEIKKAYRRKALELHPDRNYGDVERTTKLFAEVQTAYQVLSDPQERAWYDSHENEILRGDDDVGGEGDPAKYEQKIGVTSADDITRLMRRFNANVEFTDAPSGFFGFIRDTFETLAQEEEVHASREGLDIPEYPPFGHKDDDYDDVVKSFYAVWNGFATKKTFAWRDRYRTSDAEDRRMRRQMEKENKRFRDDGIREFNEAVRVLIAFVRKRDPRYAPNTQTEAERQDILRKAAAAQAAKSRAENAARMKEVVPEWTKVREPEELEEEEEEESEEEHFECVACRKTFKSENQYDAHERSKKHQKAVYALRKKLEKEGHELDLDEEETSTGAVTPNPEDDGATVEGVEELTAEEIIDDQEIVEDEDALVEPLQDWKVDDTVEEAVPDKPETLPNTLDSDAESESDPDTPSRPSSPIKLKSPPPSSPISDGEDKPKLGKAAQKRAKKAAQQAAASQEDQGHSCASCNAAFSSKTRLFQHIKDFGHAAPVAKVKGGKGKKR